MGQAAQWGHDPLASDLARKLRNNGKSWTWLNATLGSWSGPRPDVMAFARYRYDVPQIHAYEIKVSRSDLFSDLNAEKWRKYLEHCQSVTFAMPHGLARRDEIPAECGVMFRTGRGWRIERRPTNIGAPCSTVAMAKLLTCHPASEPYPGLEKYEADGLRRQARERFLQSAGRRYGEALARLAVAVADGEDPAGKAREQADQILARARAEAKGLSVHLAPVLDALGIPEDAPDWQKAGLIREAADNLRADTRIQRVERALEKARQALDEVATTTKGFGAVERAGKIFALLRQAAERGERCPENKVLAERFGVRTGVIVNAFAFLEANGMIEVERANNARVVTICATGKRTAGKCTNPHWTRRAA